MVSSEPPLARSGNSTHLLDVGIPARQVPETSHSVGITAGLPVSNPKALVTPEELAVVRERALDDINTGAVSGMSKGLKNGNMKKLSRMTRL